MKNITLILILVFFYQCRVGINYYHGYIFSSDDYPIKDLKVYEKYNKQNYSITNKEGYFRINIAKNNMSRYLIIEHNNKVIDSIQVIGYQGGERTKYSFVQGAIDTLFLNIEKQIMLPNN